MSSAASVTLALHTLFFTGLSGVELLAPSTACVDGLAGPLVSAGAPPQDMCRDIDSNPAAQLIFFGLTKYHLLFGCISAFAWLKCAAHPVLATTVRGAVLVVLGVNFAFDDAWAALHLSWLGGNALLLLPQALVAAWDIFLGWRVLGRRVPHNGSVAEHQQPQQYVPRF